MSLSSLSIRRPVLALVMSLVVVLFGVIGYSFLGVREYPAVDPPVINVSTSYRGANADVIESQITEPLEESVNAVEGIRTLTSASREGRSNLTVEFTLGTDLERAANDVRDRVSRARGNLPPDADPPIVSKADADAQPIIFFTLRSEQRDLLQMSELAENAFAERLQTIAGVSGVQIWGEKRPAMRIWLDPQRLAAYRLSPLDVRNALTRESVELPSGRVEGEQVELSVRALGRLETEEQFRDLILREDAGGVVRLRDVGRAEVAPENERTGLRMDGIPMVGVVITPQPGANHIQIVDDAKQMIEQIRKDLPDDVQIGVGFDTTRYIRSSIAEVQETIVIALALVLLIIFAFLREWRTTLVPILAIPVSLIGTFFVMYLLGYSINVLTLLGIVLAIGLVVDDAIVVLENIYAKVERGMPARQAGFAGSKEVFLAVIATSIALVGIFTPVVFLGGMTGRLFREFGVVIAAAVVISTFVALTLTPMLAVWALRKHRGHGRFYHATEPFFVWAVEGYRASLDGFLRRRWLAFPVMAGCLALSALFYGTLPREVAPLEDRSEIRFSATAPEGASFAFMQEYMNLLTERMRAAVPEIRSMVAITAPGFAGGGANSGAGRLVLTERGERERTQQEIADALMPVVGSLTGARAFVSQPQTISTGPGGGGLPVQYVLQAPNLAALSAALPRFMDAVRDDETFSFADVNLKFNRPELQVSIDRNRAAALGVSVADVAQTLQLALSEARIGYWIKDGQQYQVLTQLEREYRDATPDLRSLYVRNQRGEPVALQNLVELKEAASPPQLFRFNRYVSATVSAQLAPGQTIGAGIAAMDSIAERVLDERFSTALAGPSRDFVESSSALLFVFLLALVLIYLALAAQFESFRDPFIIMLTVPLALTGALFSLWYFGQTLNIFSQIGMIMLIGLVTKNGILIVEFANQRQARGLSLRDAVLDASAQRLRPILMTSFSTILGTLPVALALGAGAESRQPMGIAVVGGLVLATFLTLYVVPAMYSYFARPRAAEADDDEPGEPVLERAPAPEPRRRAEALAAGD